MTIVIVDVICHDWSIGGIHGNDEDGIWSSKSRWESFNVLGSSQGCSQFGVVIWMTNSRWWTSWKRYSFFISFLDSIDMSSICLVKEKKCWIGFWFDWFIAYLILNSMVNGRSLLEEEREYLIDRSLALFAFHATSDPRLKYQ